MLSTGFRGNGRIIAQRQTGKLKPYTMRSLHIVFLVPFFALLLTGCANRVYQTPTADLSARAHSVVAIIPPLVTIEGRRMDDPRQLDLQAEADVLTFQQELYNWMLHRVYRNQFIGIEIVDPTTVNIELARAGYNAENPNFTPTELADILCVDAVLTANFRTTKPVSEGVSLASVLIFDEPLATRRTTVNLYLHDPYDGMLWSYEWGRSGAFTTAENLVNALMRDASRRMPYRAR